MQRYSISEKLSIIAQFHYLNFIMIDTGKQTCSTQCRTHTWNNKILTSTYLNQLSICPAWPPCLQLWHQVNQLLNWANFLSLLRSTFSSDLDPPVQRQTHPHKYGCKSLHFIYISVPETPLQLFWNKEHYMKKHCDFKIEVSKNIKSWKNAKKELDC